MTLGQLIMRQPSCPEHPKEVKNHRVSSNRISGRTPNGGAPRLGWETGEAQTLFVPEAELAWGFLGEVGHMWWG